METKRKEIQVIMLPTKEILASNKGVSLILNNEDLVVINDDQIGKVIEEDKIEVQHLYFVSDDEIKEGDWYRVMNDKYNKDIKSIAKADKEHLLLIKETQHTCKKVIATTDKSLKRDITDSHRKHSNTLPQPPQEFIEEYCRKGGIDKVIVEYVEYKTKRYQAGFDIGDRVPIGIFNFKIIMVRKDGYYWTKRLGDWKICSFWRGSWYWENIQYDEDDFEEIDETVIER